MSGITKVPTVGDRVRVKHRSKESVGVVKFVGPIKGKTGFYYGVELDTANSGENNGTIQSIKYFATSRRKGLFVKKSAILKTNSKNNTAPRVSVGSKVRVPKHECEGTIQFIGSMDDRKGIWFGVALQLPKGTNNGRLKGREYFKCQYKHGVFLKENGFEALKSHYIIITKKKSVKTPTSPAQNIETNRNDTRPYSKVLPEQPGAAAPERMRSDTKRREDIQKVVNVLDGSAPDSDLNDVITSYDDRKEAEDIEWLKIIATLKSIHDKNKSNNNSDNNQKDAFERRLKFEKEELKQTYESHIKTLILDKQRLEKQLAKQGGNNNTDGYNDNTNEKQPGDRAEEEANKVDVEQLKREKEQADIVIRAKEEIIRTAKEEIAQLREEIAVLKEEEQKEELQVDRLSRDRAKQLLEKRVSDQQQNSLSQLTQADLAGPKKTISELLADCTEEDATDIIYSMGVIKFEYDKKLRKDTYNVDLTNNSVLRRLTNDQRKKWMTLLAHCICDDSGAQQIEKLKMSNMGIDDKLFPEFMDILIEKIEFFKAEEWWLESNKIGNEGMKKLAQFLGMTPPSLEIVKMYNNKTSTSTQVINQLLSSIEENDRIQKFTFEWRLTQHRDRIEKQLKKNQDAKRKRRWAGK